MSEKLEDKSNSNVKVEKHGSDSNETKSKSQTNVLNEKSEVPNEGFCILTPERRYLPPTVDQVFDLNNSNQDKHSIEIAKSEPNSNVSAQNSLEMMMSANSSTAAKTRALEMKSLGDRGISPWMPKPKLNTKSKQTAATEAGIDYLIPLRKLYIYERIQMLDLLFDNEKVSRNCFTVRNADLQKIYLVGTDKDKRPGNICAFSLRFIDQYNKQVIIIKKRFNFILGAQKVDIYSPHNCHIGLMLQHRRFCRTVRYGIYEPNNLNRPKFTIKREKREIDSKIKYDFVIKMENELIGKIAKRHERVTDKDIETSYNDNYVKITIPGDLNCIDKALLLSAGLLIVCFNIYIV